MMRSLRGRRRRGARGFSLIETMMAAAIFLIGFTGLTALLLNASVRRGRASKRAVVGRMAFDEFTRLTNPGFDAMPVAGAYNRVDTDPLGRQVTFMTTITDTCTDPDTTFATMPLPGGQACCPGDICCKTVRIQAQSMLNAETGQQITDTYVGFVTKGCGP